MKLTAEFIKSKNACSDGYAWYVAHGCQTVEATIDKLLEHKKYDWANWLLERTMTDDQLRQYAIYSAESVLHIYEKEYPDDERPRKAIEAAKKYLERKTEKNKAAWAAAWDAARAAAWAAARAAARDAAWAAAWDAARAAARAAAGDAAGDAAGAAAWDAARAAAWAAAGAAAGDAMYERLIKYAITLLEAA